MARAPDDEQPSLFSRWKPPTPEKTASPSAPPKPSPEAAGQPPPRTSESNSDEAPWWQRARQVAATREESPVVDWGLSWRGLLLDAGWMNTFAPGERLLYEKMVRGLDLRAGVIEGTIVPAKAKPQRVQLRLPAFTPSEWARIARQIVDDSETEGVVSSLSQGRVPMALIDAADTHQLRFLPRRLSQLAATCTCGGARQPCAHLLAVHMAFARRLEADAALLLLVRGITLSELTALIGRVSAESVVLESEPRRALTLDPFHVPDGPEPDWSLLEKSPATSLPLPPLEGWRGRESFDAMVRRLLLRKKEDSRS